MTLRRILALAVVGVCAYLLFLFGLGHAGLIGPDEPRYADIGRAMYRSGDWVTPRLFGAPWFEKPALLYWLIGGGFALGLGDTLAPRLPIALLSIAALAAYYVALRRLLGGRAALGAAVMLAISAGWLGFSHAAVTDLPLAVFFSAGMLLAMSWALRGERKLLPWAAACFGAASLAKGLVPLALALPLLAFGWRRVLDWARPAPLAAFAAVSLPWYLICHARNGQVFLDEFFWKHHVSRFFSPELQHVQPVWFYAPVLLGLLVPAMPVLAAFFRRDFWNDGHVRYFAAWAGFGLFFFSASTNKLPGYLLPLLPAMTALMGFALARMKRAALLLASVALMSGIYALAGGALPRVMAEGLRRAEITSLPWLWLAPALVGALATSMFERAGRREAALLAVLVTATVNVTILKSTSFDTLSEQASSRELWRRLEPKASEYCIGNSHRSIEYGLRYYSRGRIPLCTEEARPVPLSLRRPGDFADTPDANAPKRDITEQNANE